MKLSVIVPIHDESANIRPFYDRTVPVLDSLADLPSWELVFVNDGSQDDSGEQILRLRGQDPRVKLITLSRNFGYQAVLLAGLTLCDSDLYAMIDVDGEDPPELLSSFYEEIRGGNDVAYGIRSNREEPALITALRALFYHVNRRIADSATLLWMAEFSMITRQVRDAVLAPRTTYPFLRAEIAYAGFKRIGVPYLRKKRLHGRSHYNLFSMTRFAVAGFLAGSTFPLRMTLYLAAAAGAIFPLAVAILSLSLAEAAELAAILAFYFLIATIPMIALYLARTYKNGVSQPVFLPDKKKTFL